MHDFFGRYIYRKTNNTRLTYTVKRVVVPSAKGEWRYMWGEWRYMCCECWFQVSTKIMIPSPEKQLLVLALEAQLEAQQRRAGEGRGGEGLSTQTGWELLHKGACLWGEKVAACGPAKTPALRVVGGMPSWIPTPVGVCPVLGLRPPVGGSEMTGPRLHETFRDLQS